jgi:hypothetical protein
MIFLCFKLFWGKMEAPKRKGNNIYSGRDCDGCCHFILSYEAPLMYRVRLCFGYFGNVIWE